MRSSCTVTQGVAFGSRRKATARTMPVSPMPPMVAAKSSGSLSGVARLVVPSASNSSNHSTWSPKLPWRSWFLPCTSAAMAPPTVAKAVPGLAGGMKPRGRKVSSRSAKLTPGSQTTRLLAASKERMRSSRSVSTTRQPSLSAASP